MSESHVLKSALKYVVFKKVAIAIEKYSATY
jgi:hypothetical protein